ncbi:MAG: cell division protein ZapA [Deltaproteobacteria bacterium]|nr:cell division protein ZapA [Deltaproteobacteria bacterium]MBW2052202.1 cell division protein ZapA [Deltaproteobacteria bacterium]MBW2140773.1 cell division protein ZapA [Deltaproteobacteria bacterium]MBW2323659.1 cell division protein ZapA [Deltaproteobacteria bacterium]
MKLINVRILTQEYRIKSDASEEKILQIAEYINQQVEKLQSSSFVGTQTDLAVMAAFKAASDYFQVTEELEHLRQKVQNDAAKLAGRIDGQLAGSKSGLKNKDSKIKY